MQNRLLTNLKISIKRHALSLRLIFISSYADHFIFLHAHQSIPCMMLFLPKTYSCPLLLIMAEKQKAFKMWGTTRSFRHLLKA